MADVVIDARGQKCPIPIVQIAKAVKRIASGQTIEISATDLAFEADVKAWCNTTGHSLENLTKSGNEIKALIRLK